jgi:DNA-3-methyladenine glycosylase
MPVVGHELIVERRGRSTDLLTGPGRLAQALDIRKEDTGRMLVREDVSTLAEALDAAEAGPVVWRDVELAASVGIAIPVIGDRLLVGPRIGITKAVDLPWRFGVRDADVSKPFPRVQRSKG